MTNSVLKIPDFSSRTSLLACEPGLLPVNPKWWMKIKIAFQETWLSDPIGVVVVTTLATIVTFIGIMKLFGA